MPPTNTVRLTPIQSEVLRYAAAQTAKHNSRLTFQQISDHFKDHEKHTAVPEAIYELLENGLLAEYRDKKGQVVAKNYVITDTGKDQAAHEDEQAEKDRQRRSRARMTGTAAQRPQADDWDDQPAQTAPKAATRQNKPKRPAGHRPPRPAPTPEPQDAG